ncbi:MAG: hypothetical protein OXG35_06415, partial [Acidobacteria bacterium]|nr:hypothetical protein [Acidobacteriota bacterium]
MGWRQWIGGRRGEVREGGYTSALVQMIVDRAKGPTDAAASATAALEACSGEIALCFAAADVAGPMFARSALT